MPVPTPIMLEPWSVLDNEGKRERLLSAAGALFAREGLDAPMPAVAAAAGVGIGSVYRQFASKDDLLAALVMQRVDHAASDLERALAREGDPWVSLTDFLWLLAERQAGDDLAGEAMAAVSEHPEVIAGHDYVHHLIERLLTAGKERGRVRPDATWLDVRLLFVATRAARELGPQAWRRVLELWIDALGV